MTFALCKYSHPPRATFVFSPLFERYNVPSNPKDALADAEAALEIRSQSQDGASVHMLCKHRALAHHSDAELVDSYLNGARTLSNSRLSYLVLSQPALGAIPTPPRTPSPSRAGLAAQQDVPGLSELDASENASIGRFDVLFAAMHYLGDGMALHQCANDFFRLVASDKSDDELATVLEDEWEGRIGKDATKVRPESVLPVSLETRLAEPHGRLQKAGTQVDFHLSQTTAVGGQAFPRQKHPERHTVLLNKDYPTAQTKAMLKKCKENGVSISAALFALCNIAWARVGGGKPELPAMMYSALNLRPYLTAKALNDSYWFLAIGYFNVILPNFLPKTGQEKTFWHRARQAKVQSTQAAKNKMIVSRTRQMARERSERAQAWGKEDDERERGTWVAPAPSVPAGPSVKDILPARPAAPSAALMGLSLLGNLDGVYKAAEYPKIKLRDLTTGSRQRNGAMLLFGFTFAGKLCLSLGYDENGFAEGVVDKFWKEMQHCTEEFLA